MPIQHRARYKILANIANNSSFGKSSNVKPVTHFMSMVVVNDSQIVVKYQTTVNFGSQTMYQELRRKYREDAYKIIEAHIKNVAEEYKKAVEAKGKLLDPKVEPYEEAPQKTVSLKVLEHTISESLEPVTKSYYTGAQTSYFRVQCLVEVS